MPECKICNSSGYMAVDYGFYTKHDFCSCEQGQSMYAKRQKLKEMWLTIDFFVAILMFLLLIYLLVRIIFFYA